MRRKTVTKVQSGGAREIINSLPFEITKNGRVIAVVMSPGIDFPKCENCRDITSNVTKFFDKKYQRWRTLILCDKCRDELLGGHSKM